MRTNSNAKLFKPKLAAVGAMALALTIGTGTLSSSDAFAAFSTTATSTTAQTQTAVKEKAGFGHFKGGASNLLASDTIASLLGLTADELKTKLQAGDSLATIATAQNVSVDTVVASVTETLKTQLSTQLNNGKITQEQYDTEAAKLSDQATKLVNGEFGGKGGFGGGRGGFGFGGGSDLLASDSIASLLGLTADELKTKLQAGDSLATIAAAQNVSVDTVVASVTETLKTQLSTQLSNGKITQEQYDTEAAKLSDQATKLVNGEFGGKGGFGGGPGGHGGFGFRGGSDLLASDTVASLLGLTKDELKTKLQAGDSLATIATAQNVSVDTVIASVTEALKTQLSTQLSESKITQEQYDAQAAKLSDLASKLVNATRPERPAITQDGQTTDTTQASQDGRQGFGGGLGGRGHGGKAPGAASGSGSSSGSSSSSSSSTSAATNA